MKIALIHNGKEEKEQRIVSHLKELKLKLNYLDIAKQNLSTAPEVNKNDGFIFLLPEEKFSKSLTAFLQYSKEELKKKPAGIITYSNHLSFVKSNFEKFILDLLSIQTFPIKINMRMILGGEGILENGNIKALLKEVKWWAKTMKAEKINSKLSVKIKKPNTQELDLLNTDSLDLLLSSNYWKN